MLRFFVIFVFLCLSCENVKNDNKKVLKSKDENSFHNSKNEYYDFNDAELFGLENSLTEISGLAFSNEFLYTHNDEEGILFQLNAQNGKKVAEYSFGRDGDYEGVEVIEQKAFIVKSNGDILFYDFDNGDSKIIKNKFNLKNDIEGLGYNFEENELLIACKGETLKGEKSKEKAIYSFDLKTNKLDKKPFLNIKDKTLESYIKEETKELNVSDKFIKKLKYRVLSFAPSGISIHPKTDEVYIISARGSILLIFTPQKELKEVVFLNEKQLAQPEGICFDSQANLYISTEGVSSKGRIYKYKFIN